MDAHFREGMMKMVMLYHPNGVAQFPPMPTIGQEACKKTLRGLFERNEITGLVSVIVGDWATGKTHFAFRLFYELAAPPEEVTKELVQYEESPLTIDPAKGITPKAIRSTQMKYLPVLVRFSDVFDFKKRVAGTAEADITTIKKVVVYSLINPPEEYEYTDYMKQLLEKEVLTKEKIEKLRSKFFSGDASLERINALPSEKLELLIKEICQTADRESLLVLIDEVEEAFIPALRYFLDKLKRHSERKILEEPIGYFLFLSRGSYEWFVEIVGGRKRRMKEIIELETPSVRDAITFVDARYSHPIYNAEKNPRKISDYVVANLWVISGRQFGYLEELLHSAHKQSATAKNDLDLIRETLKTVSTHKFLEERHLRSHIQTPFGERYPYADVIEELIYLPVPHLEKELKKKFGKLVDEVLKKEELVSHYFKIKLPEDIVSIIEKSDLSDEFKETLRRNIIQDMLYWQVPGEQLFFIPEDLEDFSEWLFMMYPQIPSFNDAKILYEILIRGKVKKSE